MRKKQAFERGVQPIRIAAEELADQSRGGALRRGVGWVEQQLRKGKRLLKALRIAAYETQHTEQRQISDPAPGPALPAQQPLQLAYPAAVFRAGPTLEDIGGKKYR